MDKKRSEDVSSKRRDMGNIGFGGQYDEYEKSKIQQPMIYITSSHPPDRTQSNPRDQPVLVYVDDNGDSTTRPQLGQSPADILAQQIQEEIAAMRAMQPEEYQRYVQLRQKELNLDLNKQPITDTKQGQAEAEGQSGSKKQSSQLKNKNKRNQSTARAKTIAKNRKSGNDSHLEMQMKYKNFSEYAEKVCPDMYGKINRAQRDITAQLYNEDDLSGERLLKQGKPFSYVEKTNKEQRRDSILSQHRSDSNLTTGQHLGPDQFASLTQNRVSILQN